MEQAKNASSNRIPAVTQGLRMASSRALRLCSETFILPSCFMPRASRESPALAPPDLPATLSPAILTGLLRNEMGFKGLVVTDALEMGGIAKGFSGAEAAVRALEAGADVLLMPADPDVALKAVVAAVGGGRLTRRRIQESVAAILSAKERLGLARKRLVDLEGIGDVVDS